MAKEIYIGVQKDGSVEPKKATGAYIGKSEPVKGETQEESGVVNTGTYLGVYDTIFPADELNDPNGARKIGVEFELNLITASSSGNGAELEAEFVVINVDNGDEISGQKFSIITSIESQQEAAFTRRSFNLDLSEYSNVGIMEIGAEISMPYNDSGVQNIGVSTIRLTRYTEGDNIVPKKVQEIYIGDENNEPRLCFIAE